MAVPRLCGFGLFGTADAENECPNSRDGCDRKPAGVVTLKPRAAALQRQDPLGCASTVSTVSTVGERGLPRGAEAAVEQAHYKQALDTDGSQLSFEELRARATATPLFRSCFPARNGFVFDPAPAVDDLTVTTKDAFKRCVQLFAEEPSYAFS
eukprot:gnl/Hemi2/20407_TR6772_c0_g6_i1.p2 gnl/Hemi2/20407_TR6772_c0_g6~~gnl/Hemi2/20407_TR6772_c0_g6_i1.p2  ORF type:complete len:153 (-),score=43.89 gnl/Hemi2/20407_TR6772_c0_g6_i1:145-603(-)